MCETLCFNSPTTVRGDGIELPYNCSRNGFDVPDRFIRPNNISALSDGKPDSYRRPCPRCNQTTYQVHTLSFPVHYIKAYGLLAYQHERHRTCLPSGSCALNAGEVSSYWLLNSEMARKFPDWIIEYPIKGVAEASFGGWPIFVKGRIQILVLNIANGCLLVHAFTLHFIDITKKWAAITCLLSTTLHGFASSGMQLLPIECVSQCMMHV